MSLTSALARQVSWPALGCMNLTGLYQTAPPVEEADRIILAALDQGYNFIDTAVYYGFGDSERMVGRALKAKGPEFRKKLLIASKCGMDLDFEKRTRVGVSNTAQHIREYLAASTERLGTAPDLYYLHRIDPNTPIEESMATLDELRQEGKIKYIGLSECSAETIRRACKVARLDAVQSEYSPLETSIEGPGGVLETCKELGVTFIAYGALARGFLVGEIRSPGAFEEHDFRRALPRFQGDNFYQNLKLVDALNAAAKKKGVSTAQLCLAWVAAQGIIPLCGTMAMGQVAENWAARDIQFTQEELDEIRALVDSATPAGERFDEEASRYIQ